MDGSDGAQVTADVYCDQFGQLQCNGGCDNAHSCCGSTDGMTVTCQAGMLGCSSASAPGKDAGLPMDRSAGARSAPERRFAGWDLPMTRPLYARAHER